MTNNKPMRLRYVLDHYYQSTTWEQFREDNEDTMSPEELDAIKKIVNGDIWTDFPMSRLRDIPVELAHLVMVPNQDFHPEGDFYLDNDAGRVVPDASAASQLFAELDSDRNGVVDWHEFLQVLGCERAVPAGRAPRATSVPRSPAAASRRVPSPPIAKTTSTASLRAASRARRVASAGPVVGWGSASKPPARSSLRTSGRRRPEACRPDLGL